MRRAFVYVVSDTLLPESIRVLYEHMTAMRRAGHGVTVFYLRLREQPLHFADLPVFEFGADNVANLSRMLAGERGVRVATDWRTAHLVAASSAEAGGIYLITDVETRHVRDYGHARAIVGSYGLGLAPVTTSPWVASAVRSLSGAPVTLLPRGVGDTFRHRVAEARPDRVLYVHTGDPDQREDLFCAAIREAHEARPALELALVGQMLPPCGPITRLRPSTDTDDGLAEAVSSAGCLVVTAGHDIADPLRLEAMAIGCPVIAVQPPGSIPRLGAEANLVVESDRPHDLAEAILRLAADDGLRRDLVARGEAATTELDWERHAAGMAEVAATLAGGAPGLGHAGRERTGVSFVIPTKNAGHEWAYLLRKLEAAGERYDTETIVVDSGSTDETVRLAREHGANVIEIAPEDFTHGGARNTGADAATKDHIVFLTQDALPIGETWLEDLLRPLLADDRVAASTGRDVPRSDADLFCGWMDWNHTSGLTWCEDRIVDLEGRPLDALDPHEKRSLAQLKDTCSCVRADVFRRLRFAEVDFAEDLDLGMRLLDSGYRLALLFSAGVIHSHNREALYILKRFFVDSKLIPRMLGFTPEVPRVSDDHALWSIGNGYATLKAVLAAEATLTPGALARRLAAAGPQEADGLPGDPSLDAFVASLDGSGTSFTHAQDAFLPGFGRLLEAFDGYVRTVHGDAVLEQPAQLTECYHKLFAAAVGSQLGSLLSAEEGNPAGPRLRALDRRLSEGV